MNENAAGHKRAKPNRQDNHSIWEAEDKAASLTCEEAKAVEQHQLYNLI